MSRISYRFRSTYLIRILKICDSYKDIRTLRRFKYFTKAKGVSVIYLLDFIPRLPPFQRKNVNPFSSYNFLQIGFREQQFRTDEMEPEKK